MTDTESGTGISGTSGSIATSSSTATVVVSSSESINSASESESEQENQSREPLSLLSKLRAPQPSDFARKRRVAANSPPRGKRRSHGTTDSSPKSVRPEQRVHEHPNQI